MRANEAAWESEMQAEDSGERVEARTHKTSARVKQATADLIRFPVERRREQRLVPISGLQELFGGSERWWRYKVAEGMPTHRFGRRLRFDPDEVRAWMAERYPTNRERTPNATETR